MLNPDPPPKETCEIVTLDPPVFVTVADKVCLTPTATLPKLRLEGFEVSGPAGAPLPERLIVRVEFDALDVMLMDPVTAPGAVGWNEALKVALCPDASVIGVVSPLMLKPDPPPMAT